MRSTTELPSPAAARPTPALRRSRPITRPRLGRWTLSTTAGRTSVAARRILCSPSCALPPVTGLGVVFAGEFSREVGQFISAVAEKGTVVPERFGCCHGSDQARGVVAGFVRRAFGRTSLRGVARIRQAPLAAILGGAMRADSFPDGGMAGAENAWGASGGHVHGAETGPLPT